MARGGKPRHVRADLCHDAPGQRLADPGDGGQALDRRAEQAHGRPNSRFDGADRRVQCIDARWSWSKYRWWSVTRPCRAACKAAGVARRWPVVQAASRTGSGSPATRALRIARALAPRRSRRTSRSCTFASSKTFWIRRRWRAPSRTSCWRVRARSRSVDGRRWDEAPPDEAVGEQIGQPHGVVRVALAPGDVADVLRVRQDEGAGVLQDVPDGLPVRARRLL